MKSVSAILTIDKSPSGSHSGRAGGSRFARGSGLLKLVAVLIVILPGSKLYASCGDYLFRNGRSVSHAMDRLPLTAGQLSTGNLLAGDLSSGDLFEVQVFGGIEGRVPGGHPPERPCSGPNCSQSPTPLSSPEVPITNLRGFDQATLTDSLGSLSSDRSETERPASEHGAKHMPARIFRPPAAF